MATARKAWFRVASSVVREAWDNDMLATMVRLSAMMNDRWARDGLSAEQASTITLTRTELELITGRRRADVARTLAERLANVLTMSVEHRGNVVVIHWPKWPEFQGLTARSRGKVSPDFAPSAHAPAPAPAGRRNILPDAPTVVARLAR